MPDYEPLDDEVIDAFAELHTKNETAAHLMASFIDTIPDTLRAAPEMAKEIRHLRSIIAGQR